MKLATGAWKGLKADVGVKLMNFFLGYGLSDSAKFALLDKAAALFFGKIHDRDD